jgi:V/A-type H+-transporting ATPase subunit I
LAVARLVRVTLEAPRGELGRLLGKVIEFTLFHPWRKEGMVQDIGLLLLGSKAHEVYAQASELLGEGRFKTPDRGRRQVEKFEAHDIDELVRLLDEYLDTIQKNLSLFTKEDDKWGVTQVLLAIQEASLMVFNDLQRIFVYPPDGGGGTTRFEGFVPAHSLEPFKDSMGGYVVSTEPVKTQGKDVAYIPTLLVNPRLISVFESLTLQRGLPRYGEVDPTPILAFVFPFFFGVMFADVGHGIALLAFGLYLVYRTAYRAWGELILFLSFSTTAFGFVRGSVFGVPFTSPLEQVIRLPSVLSAGFTLSSIPFLLEVAILIGTFHLASGYAIAFVNQERAGNYLDAFLDKLPTIVLYSFFIPFGFAVAGTGLNFGVLFTSAAPTPIFNNLLGVSIPIATTARVSLPVMVATIVFLVAGHPIRDYLSTRTLRSAVRGLGDGLLEAVAKPLEFFLNTLSYIRLGVLLITTTLLGSLVAGVLSYGIVGVAVAALLNVAVISLEGVIVYIQDMRLQLYEWLSQFYAGTGTPFVSLVSRGDHFTIRWL